MTDEEIVQRVLNGDHISYIVYELAVEESDCVMPGGDAYGEAASRVYRAICQRLKDLTEREARSKRAGRPRSSVPANIRHAAKMRRYRQKKKVQPLTNTTCIL